MSIYINRATEMASTFYKDYLSTLPSRVKEASSTIKNNYTLDVNHLKQKMGNIFSKEKISENFQSNFGHINVETKINFLKNSFKKLIHGQKNDTSPTTSITNNNIATIGSQIIQKPYANYIVKPEMMEHPANHSNLDLDFTDRNKIHKNPYESIPNNITHNHATQEQLGKYYI